MCSAKGASPFLHSPKFFLPGQQVYWRSCEWQSGICFAIAYSASRVSSGINRSRRLVKARVRDPMRRHSRCGDRPPAALSLPSRPQCPDISRISSSCKAARRSCVPCRRMANPHPSCHPNHRADRCRSPRRRVIERELLRRNNCETHPVRRASRRAERWYYTRGGTIDPPATPTSCRPRRRPGPASAGIHDFACGTKASRRCRQEPARGRLTRGPA